MSKFLSGRLRQLLVGIRGYTENKTVLQTTGKVGIGTTDAQHHSLFVVGSTNITGDTIVGGGLTAVGIGSFQNDVYIDQQLYVGGIEIIGGSTIGQDIVTRNLEVSGISSFNGLVDINADGQANSFKVEDLTNDRVVIAGVGGELEDDGNLTFNGSQLSVGVDLDVDGHTELDNVNVSGVATIHSLDVQTNFDVFDSQATFHNNVHIAGNLSIGGTTTIIAAQDLQIFDKDIILGVTTDAFGNDVSTEVTANHGGIAIASTEGSPLVDLSLTGFDNDIPSTYKQLMWVSADSYGVGTTDAWHFNYAVGIGSTLVPNGTRLAVGQIKLSDDTISTPNINVGNDANITGDLDVDGHTELDNLNVTGVSTFTNVVDFNNDIDVDGHTELDNVNISGVTTFVGAADFNNDIDVDGHAELDQLNVSGVSTFAGLVDANGGLTANIATVEDLTDNRVVIVGAGGRLEDDGNLTFDGSNLTIGVGLDVDGHTELDNVNISGVTTFAGNIDANADLDVDGTTNLDVTNIDGLLTINADIDANGDLDVDGHTELDNLNVSGVSTFVGVGTFQGDLYVGGDLYVKDDLVFDEFTGRNINITGVATFITVDINGDLDVDGQTNLDDLNVDGHAELDNVNVSGVSTFVGTANFSGDIDVDGHTELDNVNISGVTTFVGNIDANGDIDVDGHTELDDLNVSGVSTFVGVGTFQGDLYVGGDLYVQNDLVFDEFTARNAVLNENLYVAGLSTFVGIATAESTFFTNQLSVAGVSSYFGDLNFGSNVDLVLSSNGTIRTPNLHSNGTDLTIRGGGNTSVRSGIVIPNNTNSDFEIQGPSSGTGDIVIDSRGSGEVIIKDGGVQRFTTNNIGVDITGHTELDQLNVSGVSTFVGIATAQSTLFANQLSVSGFSTLTNLQVTGLTPDGTDFGTSQYLLRANGSGGWEWADIPGIFSVNNILNGFNVSEEGLIVGTAGSITQLDFRGVNVIASADPQPNGIATITFSKTPTFDTLNVTGIATFAQDVEITGNLTVNGTQTILNTTQLEVEDINIGIASADPKLSNAALDGAGITIYGAAGDKSLTWSNLNSRMEFNTDLFATNFSTGNITATGDLDVDGHTDLDNVSISGVTTTTGLLDANGGLTANQATVEDLTNDRIVIAGGGGRLEDSANLTFDGTTLNVVGQTDVDDLNVSGVSTFVGVGTFQNDLFVGGALDVEGNINFNGLLFQNNTPFIASYWVQTDAGIHTLGSVGIGTTNPVGSLEVSGHTELDNLNVSGVSTFNGTTEVKNSSFKVTNSSASGQYLEIIQNVDSSLNLNKVGSGSFFIEGNNIYLGDDDSAQTYAGFERNGKVFLNHNGTTRLETTGYGVTVYDTIEAPQLNITGIASVGTAITMYPATGIISATAFYGDGANLANTGSTLSAATGTQRVVLTSLTSGTMVTSSTDGDLTFTASNNLLAVPNLQVTGLTTDGTNFGTSGYFAVSDGAGGWNWRQVGVASATGTILAGFTVEEEGSVVGSASSTTTINFIGSNITATDAGSNVVDITLTEDPQFNTLSVTGISTFGGQISAGGTVGTSGQYLQSTGIGVTWANFPSLRTTQANIATDNQTAFVFTYNVNFLDVFVNGVKLATNEYTATNGTDITLTSPAFGGDIVEFHSYNTAALGSSGSATVLNDLTDVTIGPLSDNQILQYNSSNAVWENVAFSSVSSTKSVRTYTATSSQTTFSATYDVGYVDVYLNGSKLSEDQYTATNGTSVVLGTGATAGDIVEIVGFKGTTGGFAQKSVSRHTATSSQTSFSATYDVGYVDVYLNGVKLSEDQYTATDGSSIVLDTGATAGDVLEIVGLRATPTGGGGGGGTTIVGAGGTWATDAVGINTVKSVGIGTEAQSGYKLYVEGDARVTGILTVGPASVTIDGINNEVTVGTGITLYGNTGIISATSLSVTGTLSGDASSLTGLTGASAATYGNSSAVPQITVDANGRITGISNVLISGGGGGGTSIVINDNNSLVGTAGTINFGTGLDVTPVSAGIVTVTVDGSELTSLNASQLTSGTVPDARFPATLPSASGANLTSLNASNLGSGTIPDARFPATLPSASGANLTSLNASNLGSGTIPDARFPSTLPAVSGANLTNITPANVSAWSLSGNGSVYFFSGSGFDGTESNPDLYLVRGQKYRFNSSGSHPFQIQSTFGAGGTVYNDGVTNNNSATVDFNVQNDAPDVLFYQCTNHSAMRGKIIILGDRTIQGSWTAAAGVLENIDTITGISSINIKSAEYTLHIEHSSGMQAQKVLAMQTGSTAYSQEFAIMYDNSLLVSVGSSVHNGNFYLNATPETGVTGITTYRFTRQTMR